MPKDEIEIRIDDVLLYKELTTIMQKALNQGSWFEQFKEFDKFFEKNNIKTILAVCVDGIDQYPEWVEYIKKNKDRYQIEMHGATHINYRNKTEEFGIQSLAEAKKKIEMTFGVKVTRWYNPFHIRGYPKWGERVCKKLHIGFNTALDQNKHHYRSHYWNPKDVKRIKGICKHYYNV
jgi:hypothetical protein